MQKFKTFTEQVELQEGVNDPAIFKAVFLAGGPGSGKSFIAGKTGLGSFGFRIINSDDAFENSMKKAGMEMSPEEIFSVKGQELRGKATEITAKKKEIYLKGRLGIVIDGTGKDFDKLNKQRKELEKLGYDCAIIIVNTNLDTAVGRDQARKRTIGKKMLEPMWQAVQDNIGKFQTAFGRSKTFIVDNSDVDGVTDKKAIAVMTDKKTMAAYKGVGVWAKKAPDNSKARKWIASETKNKTR
jgi:shikimate kinase|tara:strand:- start:1835 stop:2557 length:723 start_codon:yes stop_codon:yes gene_type:complete